MSLESIVGAMSSAMSQARALEQDAVEGLVAAAQPALEVLHDAVAPVAVGLLQQVAANPQLFGPDASSLAEFLARVGAAEPTGNPLLLPDELGIPISFAAR